MLRKESSPDDHAGRATFEGLEARGQGDYRKKGGGARAVLGFLRSDRPAERMLPRQRHRGRRSWLRHKSALGRTVLADQSQDERAAMGRGAMLEKEYSLPCAELHPSIGDRDAQLRLGQRALDVGRHIVRPLVVVAVEGDVFRNDPL